MKPERWRQVQDLCHAALARAPEGRAAFLATACLGDDVLRHEVESLLAQEPDASGFMSVPAVVGASAPLDHPKRTLVGQRLGAYEVLAPQGAGGMGEVYRARDSRLDRIVAIKVLPAHVAADPERKQRFEREAKTIAALSHPHICPVFDIGQQDGIDFLVMEYLEGQTLAERLEKGALPLDQALHCAIQIADALDNAHRNHIIHRDLKPGNVMLTRTGAKLLDFGLAKFRPGIGLQASDREPAALPDVPPASAVGEVDCRRQTAPGTILGTLPYMAPEQLEGREADARTDLFAFGAVVYEMITGKQAFAGKSQACLIGAIMHADPPPVSALQPLAPPTLDRIVRKCLAKDPDRRWQSASDLTDELRWISHAPDGVAATGLPIRRGKIERVAWVVAVLALVALAVPAALYFQRPVPEPIVTRLDIVTPPTTDAFSVALSPDGRQLAFIANSEKGSQLWLRPLDEATAKPLAGTEGATSPFWSPDDRAIGFFADGKLKRLDLRGGAPQVLAEAPIGRGGTWNRDGVIVFSPNATGGLMRVPATGGVPAMVTRPGAGQASHRWPQFLPDGRHFLFLVFLGPSETRGLYLGSLDGGASVRVLETDTAPLFAPPGYLLLVSQDTLVARRFDTTRGVLSGEPLLVAQSVGNDSAVGRIGLSISEAGVLAHRSGAATRRQLVWVDRAGKTLGSVGAAEATGHVNPELARDGARVAFQRNPSGNADVWLIELKSGIASRFTYDAALDNGPVWSPDGARIAFRSSRNGRHDLFEKTTNGASNERPLLVTGQDKAPQDWSPDGKTLLYTTQDPKTLSDLWALPLTGDRKPFPVAQTGFDEVQGQFAPDGRWITYASNETGRYEIYLRRFPDGGGKRQLTTEGGIYPRWRRDGRELFYLTLDDRLMAVPLQPRTDGRTVRAGTPFLLFATRIAIGANVGIGGFASKAQYAVAPDGRFLLNVSTDDPALSPITIVQNWTAALKK